MARTRLGQIGVGVEPYGGFAPKSSASVGPHNPGRITRLQSFGIMGRRCVFVAKGGAFFAGLGLGGTGEDEAVGARKRGQRGKIFKPTGLPPIRANKRSSEVEVTPVVVEPELQSPAQATLQPDTAVASLPVTQRSLAQIEREIGYLLRKQLRTHDEEIVLLLLMAAAAAI